jgi:ribosomal protein L2
VPIAAYPVQENSQKPYFGVKIPKTSHQGRDTLCHSPSVNHQQYRKGKYFRNLSTTSKTIRTQSVKKAHDPFKNGNIGGVCSTSKEFLYLILPQKEKIQVIAFSAADQPVISRIDVIRPHLEGQYPKRTT